MCFAAVYVGVIMMICTLSLAMNIFVLNIYHRSPRRNDMPRWVRLFSDIRLMHAQGRSQEFATGDKRGGLGDGSPLAGSRGRAPVRSSPQKPETNANFQPRRGTCTHLPLAIRRCACTKALLKQ